MREINLAGGHFEQFVNELFMAYKKQLPGNWTQRGDLIEEVLQIKLCLVVKIKPITGGASQTVVMDAPEAIVSVEERDKRIITGNE